MEIFYGRKSKYMYLVFLKTFDLNTDFEELDHFWKHQN